MPQEDKPASVNSQLCESLAGFASKNIPLEKAKESLIASGWTDEEIEAALAYQPYNVVATGFDIPSFAVQSENESIDTGESSTVVRVVFILTVCLFVVTGTVILLGSASRSSETEGTITAANCIKENGTVQGGLGSKVCKIGSVQLTIID